MPYIKYKKLKLGGGLAGLPLWSTGLVVRVLDYRSSSLGYDSPSYQILRSNGS
jgi:hypothetical protein